MVLEWSCVLLQTISNSIVHDNVSSASAITKEFDGPGVGHAYICKKLQAKNDHDNVSTVLAIIIDFGGLGVGNAYLCKRFQIASCMTM